MCSDGRRLVLFKCFSSLQPAKAEFGVARGSKSIIQKRGRLSTSSGSARTGGGVVASVSAKQAAQTEGRSRAAGEEIDGGAPMSMAELSEELG